MGNPRAARIRASPRRALVTLASLWLLYPSWQYYTMPPAQRTAMDASKLAQLRKKAIHLG